MPGPVVPDDEDGRAPAAVHQGAPGAATDHLEGAAQPRLAAQGVERGLERRGVDLGARLGVEPGPTTCTKRTPQWRDMASSTAARATGRADPSLASPAITSPAVPRPAASCSVVSALMPERCRRHPRSRTGQNVPGPPNALPPSRRR